MRILYIDIDSLRPDHLGSYGYHRVTSPNIDSLAANGLRFNNMFISDSPCLPSRTALWSGRFGFRTGVLNHGGAASQPVNEGRLRGHQDSFGSTGWMTALRRAGLYTATVSSFGERHAAWHWYAGYNEIHNPGKLGMDIADDVTPLALDWLNKNARRDDWFLHVNYWDPHTPYRTPLAFGSPFEHDPLPEWLTEDVWQRGWQSYGPHSPQEPYGMSNFAFDAALAPRATGRIESMELVKAWIDGYDTGIRYVDEHIGRLLNALADANVLDDTLIMVSADHAENQGELNIWGDHHTADAITCHIPLIVHAPALIPSARVDNALHYHFDWAATLIELAGGTVPANWNGRPFTESVRSQTEQGRDHLVLSCGTWTAQRSVRFDDYICIYTYHNGYRPLEPVELYDLANDPHEQRNVASENPALVNQAGALLANWLREMAQTSHHNTDPIMTILREGGPYYLRGELKPYIAYLQATGRAQFAEQLAAQFPGELI